MIRPLLYLIQYEYITRIKKKDVYDEAGLKKLSEEGVYKEIKEALDEKKPFCIGKIGGTESFAVSSVYFRWKCKSAYEQLCRCAGFFPNEYNQEAFYNYYKEQTTAIGAMDMIINYPKKYEFLHLMKYAKSDLKWCLRITPWLQNKPWIQLLENRKVLVIHPFAKSIEKQYQRREKIFADSRLLPKFDLYTITAVQTIADNYDERFSSWKNALDYMTQQAQKVDFDIALIGCGAYGLPLAARIKKWGKVGIHCGGELQTYFGIHGKRWDEGFPEKMQKLCNEYWIRPDDGECPKGFQKVENGCYW